MHRVYLIIGGNIGNREWYLKQMIVRIEKMIGSIVTKSDIYESEPWGFDHQTPFLNQALEVQISLTPLCLLDTCQSIEKSLGRENYSDGYEARTADIDILFFDDCIFTLPPLILPHKLLHERMFVLEPLSQIASDFIHPLLGLSIAELKSKCEDSFKVWKYKPVSVRI